MRGNTAHPAKTTPTLQNRGGKVLLTVASIPRNPENIANTDSREFAQQLLGQ